MCHDDNVFGLWGVEAYGDSDNQQFTYSRSALQRIAELFPADPVGWGSAVPNAKQAALLLGILNITHTLLLQFDNWHANFLGKPAPWQEERAALVKKIQRRYQKVYDDYLANPDVPLVNMIPKWNHGFYANVALALENRSYTPDRGFQNRTFDDVWFDHKPNNLYGPVWASFDWRLEPPLQDLTRSFYALFNDRLYSSWYITLTSYLPMFLGDSNSPDDEGSVPNAVNWILNSSADLSNFTALTKQYLTPAQQTAVMAKVIYKAEADLLTTIVKLARVYSFDRANLVAEVVVLPQWTGYPDTGGFGPPNWCTPRINLGGVHSDSTLYASVSSLQTGDILQMWGFADEVFSELPKFLLVSKAATPTSGAIIEDVWLDIAEKGDGAPTWPRPTRTPVRREVSLDKPSDPTTMSIVEFEERGQPYHSNTSMSIVQLFGTLVAPDGNLSLDLLGAAPVDVNRLIANGQWHDREARPPLETWGFDSAHRFCRCMLN
jgi:hypothetical protein